MVEGKYVFSVLPNGDVELVRKGSTEREDSFIIGSVRGDVLVVSDIWVNPADRGKGIGFELLKRLIREVSPRVVKLEGVTRRGEKFWLRASKEFPIIEFHGRRNG